VHDDRELPARMRARQVPPAPILVQELARAPVGSPGHELVSALANELDLGDDLDEGRELVRDDARLGVATQSTVGTALEREAVDEGGVEFRKGAHRTAPSAARSHSRY
jgi:hypothetical protein